MDNTLLGVMQTTAARMGTAPALVHKQAGRWCEISWEDYYRDVRRVARGFIKLGLEPGGAVNILGFNRPEWLVCDLAAVAAGAVPVGIYLTSSPEQCEYIAAHSEATIAVVENANQLAKFKRVRSRLPSLKAIVMMEGSEADDSIYGWSDLLALGDQVPESELDARLEKQTPNDVATLIYTSGTTGDPKAVQLTHSNLCWLGENIVQNLDLRQGECVLSYLPLAHIAEQNLSILGPLAAGMTVWFAESLDALGDNLLDVRPHGFFGVPRVWEKIQAKIHAASAEPSTLRRTIVTWARNTGRKAAAAEESGGSKPLLYPLANKLVFNKVQARLGLDRCRYRGVGAAPVSPETLDFFASFDMRLYEVYGQSESTGAGTFNRPGDVRSGSIGKPWPGTELRIAEDGEILLRGPHVFSGYLKNEKATQETVDEKGWLHTGDIGHLNDDGFAYITDRKKELIITAGGENVSPAHVEGALKKIPVVSQVCVIGDRRKYLAALFTLDEENLHAAAVAAGSEARTPQQAWDCAKFQAWFSKQLGQVNRSLARVQTIKRYRILPTDFSVEGGELTPTMKLKRRVIYEKYADDIETLYKEKSA